MEGRVLEGQTPCGHILPHHQAGGLREMKMGLAR